MRKLKVLCPDGRIRTAHRQSENCWKVTRCVASWGATVGVSGSLDGQHNPVRFLPRGKNAWAVMPKVRP